LDVDSLFKLPLDEFTAARNALASRMKKSGRAEDAASLRALSKPSISAWVVNQLYWRNRQDFDRLIKTGQQFVKAQSAQLSGKPANLHAALDARREALSELTTLATGILHQSGHAPSPDMMRRITTTLEALATYGEHPEAPRAGRLTDDIDPPGFEALAALIPRSGSTSKTSYEPTRVLPFTSKPRKSRQKKQEVDESQRREAERLQARKALEQAERELKQAMTAAAEAETALKKAAAHARAADEAKQDAEARLEKASAAADEARQEARRVAAQAEEAAQVVADAERASEQARRKLDELL
jgi:DNA repair exonuclease SbcCD ATPase subunit